MSRIKSTIAPRLARTTQVYVHPAGPLQATIG